MLHHSNLISRIQVGKKAYCYYPIHTISGYQKDRFLQLPYSVRILIEACYRRALQ